ncbi:redoxin domain-containing protein [Desertibaculum subflavum]|uniref:redoxin domain-containing protein n=1 Tax=Desertibaculum subflavum TaxID=2268458 RepID=UPI000E6652FC
MSLTHILDPVALTNLPPAALRVGDHAPDADLRFDGQRTRLHRWSDDAWVALFALGAGDALDRAAETRRLAALLPEFRARFVKLLGVAMRAWPGEASAPFAVAFDPDGEMMRGYGLTPSAQSVAVIDPEHRVRLLLGYPPRRERDFGEVLRLIAGLQRADARSRADRSDWRLRQAATLGSW